MRIGRRIAVRVSVWALRDRNGHSRLSELELRGALEKAFPHRNVVWRTEVIEEAEAKLARHGQGKRR